MQDVDENENAINVTAGYLRASLRAVDQATSERGAPVLPCRAFEAVPVGEKVSYRIPLVPNARRFRAGHKLRLHLTADDQNPDRPALLEFRHASIGTSSLNTVFFVIAIASACIVVSARQDGPSTPACDEQHEKRKRLRDHRHGFLQASIDPHQVETVGR